MRIGIDVDNTLYQLAPEMQAYFSKRLGVELPIETAWDSHSVHWGLSKNQYSDLIEEGVESRDLFWNGEQMLGASRATRLLTEMGHTIVVATARRDTKSCRRATREWLLKECIWYDELIFNRDKREAHADIFLDDKPSNIPTLILAGTDAVYFDQPWNMHLPYPRVSSWAEFVEYVKEHNV